MATQISASVIACVHGIHSEETFMVRCGFFIGQWARLTARQQLVYFRPPMQLRLYSREWCSWCIDAKDYLSEKGYCFQEIDVGKDRTAYEEMKQLSAQTYVPTFVAGDKVLANFDTNQLQRFLNEHQINP